MLADAAALGTWASPPSRLFAAFAVQIGLVFVVPRTLVDDDAHKTFAADTYPCFNALVLRLPCMKSSLLPSLLFAVVAILMQPVAAAAAPAAPARAGHPVLFVCGDSTAARDRPPLLGWAEQLGAFFDPAKLQVENRARAGRSARSFIAEGLWGAVRDQLRPGDVVLLQFGHNDSKNAMNIARFDLSGTGPEVEAATDPQTGAPVQVHTFGYYLREMIDQARAAGATVVVLSPVPRNKWENGRIVRGEEQHGPWAAAVAQAAGVPFVNANELIAKLYDPIGQARLKAMYFPRDNTHTNPAGARVNAACIVTGLAALDLPVINRALQPDALAQARAAMAGVAQTAAATKLAVPLAAAFPAPGATQVCPDTPLRLSFETPPTLGTSGRIHIVDTATGRDADTIDLSQPVALKTVGGEPNYRYYPVIISGHTATIYPRNGALAYGHTYVVTADAGVFNAGRDAYAALDRSAGWQFTTRAAPPAAGTTRLTVAADGTGDFCTVQGALDFIPAGNTTPTTIFVRKGLYTEEIFFTDKNAITLRGEDRRQTVIAYATNEKFNKIHGNPFGLTQPDPAAARRGHGNIYHRGVFLAHHVQDLTVENLTLRNTTPQGGSQAEAIILNGTTDAHAILKDVDLYSYQDTLQINGQAYLTHCYIEGDVDFMWGTGPCFFDHCTCRALRSGAYYTQIRNPGTNHGYVYVDCTFDGAQGIMGNYLSRIGTGRFPHSEVVLLNCTLTHAVGPVAWMLLGGREGNPADIASVHFWEFGSHDPAGRPVDATFRLPGSRRLTEAADGATIAHYRDPAYVLGGWNPLAAPALAHPAAPAPADAAGTPPTIVRQPASQLALLGTPAVLTVVARARTGGRVAYRWFKDGQLVPGAGSPTLRIAHMSWADAAVYTVEASNQAGRITSAPAELTAVAPQADPAPALPRIPEATFNVTGFGAVADGTTDNTAAIQHAIDTAVAAGGGTVVVPAGDQPYLCGPLTLGSHVDLEIDTGATLRLLPYAAEPKPGAYPLRGHAYPNFLTAAGAHDVALTGGGTIDGQGEAWWAAFRANHRMPHRPFLVRLEHCERVLLAGVTLRHSPMFHAAISANDLTVFGLTIQAPETAPNTDGIDPSGARILIQNCAVSVGDDNVVLKPGREFCRDITVADCAFGAGHGMSVGGQSNRGLDGMVVKNCSFDGTTSGLRLKADPTQGGPVRNISYLNLQMERVPYPIVFYSYYSKVGNPAALSGGNLTTPAKVHAWNARPPYALASSTLPSWRDITVRGLYSADTRGHSIIWGLPAAGCLIENVRLQGVHIRGGASFEVYDAAGVSFEPEADVGEVTTANALVLVRQPHWQAVAAGATATFEATVAAPNTAGGATVSYQWTRNGQPLRDGPAADGTIVRGATTSTLTLDHVAAAAAGKYAVVASTKLDGYDAAKQSLLPGSVPATATSAPAALVVK